MSRQKRSWQIWSDLHNITIEIFRALTIKLTRARARSRDRARAMAMVSFKARAWECVYVYAPGPFLQADQI